MKTHLDDLRSLRLLHYILKIALYEILQKSGAETPIRETQNRFC